MSETPKNKPPDTPFRQQTLAAWQPILTPKKVMIFFAVIGILFVALGSLIYSQSESIVELTAKYDEKGTSDYPDCQTIGGECDITFTVKDDMSAPVYVYYELTNFYQNHRTYVKSFEYEQLQGTVYTNEDDVSDCDPLKTNGTDGKILNPCGVIANSLFNDKIVLATSSKSGVTMTTTDIAWNSDKEDKFAQPEDFASASATEEEVGPCIGSECPTATCTSLGLSNPCKGYNCSEPNYYNCEAGYYAYHYPDSDNQQYLYQTFPEVVSPLKGVTDEHFIVWMRTAALPSFRKLYGVIDSDLSKGDTLTFTIGTNFEVTSFDGSKSLVLSTTQWFGGKNSFLGTSFITVGVICIVNFLLLVLKSTVLGARHLGDRGLME